MTENEAIKSLEYARRILGLPEHEKEWSANRETIAIDMALKALKEIQQYQEIGTAEECQKTVRKLKEHGKLLMLPCAVGDMLYTNLSMKGWYFRKENRPYGGKVVFIGINGADGYINVDFGNGHMLQFHFSEIGKTVFLAKSQAEAILHGLEGKK